MDSGTWSLAPVTDAGVHGNAAAGAAAGGAAEFSTASRHARAAAEAWDKREESIQGCVEHKPWRLYTAGTEPFQDKAQG